MIFGEYVCALCQQVVDDEDEVVVTRDFFKPDDPLWPYANAVMHSHCFFFWDKKDEFLLPRDVIRQHTLSVNYTRIIGLMRRTNEA